MGDALAMAPVVLIVEDDADFREGLAALVAQEGLRAVTAGTLAEARERIRAARPELVIADLRLPDGDGLELVARGELPPEVDVVVVTGHASVDSAVAALREGATDYLCKPLERGRLASVLAHVARRRELRGEVERLRDQLRELGRFGPLVGRSRAMQEVYELVTRVAPTDATVLVCGESGTGKELVAETIHQLSRRRQGPFLAVNCGGISPQLIESELFGHEKGSFTGADRRRQGFFEQAAGGTLLLDEITETPLEFQVKLLRALESRTILRVGGSEPVAVDVRLIAATNRSTEEAVRSGRLREDLFYRLHVFPIAVPPLRSREGDVELLAQHFLEDVNQREGVRKHWAPEALERLRALPWPGNVRELRNAVQRAAILAEREIGPELLPETGEPPARRGGGPLVQARVGLSIEEVERSLILATLDHLGGDKKRAAEVLGISLKTLYNRLNVYKAQGLWAA